MAATESKSYMKNHYVGKTAEQVWTLWDPEQRRHFLKDHEFDEYGDMEYSHDSAKTRPSFNELDYKVQRAIMDHVSRGQYAEGGGLGAFATTKDFFEKADFSHLPEAARVFIKEQILTDPAIETFPLENETLLHVVSAVDAINDKVKEECHVEPEVEPVIEEEIEPEVEIPATPPIDLDEAIPEPEPEPIEEPAAVTEPVVEEDPRIAIEAEIETLTSALPYVKGADKKVIKESLASLNAALKYLPEAEKKEVGGDVVPTYSKGGKLGKLAGGWKASLYHIPAFISAENGWQDTSSANDESPSFWNEKQGIKLWISEKSEAARDGAKQYSIQKADAEGIGEGEDIFSSNSEKELKSFVEKRAAGKPEFIVMNQTDGIPAYPQTYKTRDAARKAIKAFRKRFEKQGFYKSAAGEEIKPADIKLEIVPTGEPILKDGGGVDLSKMSKKELVEHWTSYGAKVELDHEDGKLDDFAYKVESGKVARILNGLQSEPKAKKKPAKAPAKVEHLTSGNAFDIGISKTLATKLLQKSKETIPEFGFGEKCHIMCKEAGEGDQWGAITKADLKSNFIPSAWKHFEITVETGTTKEEVEQKLKDFITKHNL